MTINYYKPHKMLKYFTVFFRKKKNPLACTVITAAIVIVGLGMAQGGHTRGQTPGHVREGLTLFL